MRDRRRRGNRHEHRFAGVLIGYGAAMLTTVAIVLAIIALVLYLLGRR